MREKKEEFNMMFRRSSEQELPQSNAFRKTNTLKNLESIEKDSYDQNFLVNKQLERKKSHIFQGKGSIPLPKFSKKSLQNAKKSFGVINPQSIIKVKVYKNEQQKRQKRQRKEKDKSNTLKRSQINEKSQTNNKNTSVKINNHRRLAT